ncbi:MAG: hypothetical protein HC902_03300 [Calothrix sp. SM1_5_4]|nr:hypothetical protein [Calothrix sp. SM1_5_4]
MFLKFNREDASFGITKGNLARDSAQYRRAVSRMSERYDGEVIAQSFIPGREVSVAVWGNSRVESLPPWELGLRGDEVFATARVKFDASYRRKRGIRARKYAGDGAEELRRRSARMFRALDMSGYARFDFRIDASGESYLIDVNANPNLARGEDFACSAGAEGIEYIEMIDKIVRLGLAYAPRR